MTAVQRMLVKSSVTLSRSVRRYPIGAEALDDGRTHFRVWAPKANKLDVVLESTKGGGGRGAKTPPTFVPLTREKSGYFSGMAEAGAGARYRFRINDDEKYYPDPASRLQPEGPHGPSVVVDHTTFPWTDQAWKGIALPGQVFYEMHIGAFTSEGTWAAAAKQLAELARIGIGVIEIMPIADFRGPFRLGLRWCRSFRADASLWNAGRSAQLCRSSALVRARV